MALPVGTTVLLDTFSAGSWANGRVPNSAYGSPTWSSMVRGSVTGGEVLGSAAWNSGLGRGSGSVVFGTPLVTTGYAVEVLFRVNPGAGLPGTGNWDGFSFIVFAAGAPSGMGAQSGMDGGSFGSGPNLTVWNSPGTVSDYLGGPNINGGAPHKLRLEVGSRRHDYYYDDELVRSKDLVANLSIDSIQLGIGYSNCAITSFSVVTIPDNSPPAFWTSKVNATEFR